MPAGATPDLREAADRPGAAPGSAGRRRRRRRWLRRLPWWVSVGFDRTSVGLVVLVMCAGVVAVGLVGVRHFFFKDGAAGDNAVLASRAPIDYGSEADPRFGQDIAPLQRLRWQRFGRPLHIGPRGIPLIENEITGDVREMTELEMTFPHGMDYARDPVDRSVVYAPGPTGYAVRWWLPEVYDDLPPARAFDRVGWFVEHETRLEQAVADVSLGLTHVANVPPGSWNRRWGEELAAIAGAITDRHAYGDPDYWVLVGALAYCSDSLEAAYRGGVTQGCPSRGYQDTVAVIWRDLGRLVTVMDRLGKSAMLRSHHQAGHLYRDVDVGDYQVRQLTLLDALLADVRDSFGRLREYGDAEGYYVQVDLP